MEQVIEQTIGGAIFNLIALAVGLWFNGIRQSQARQRDADALQKETRQELKAEVETLNKKVTALEQTNATLQNSLQEQVQAQTSERVYYRDTIRELRNDSRNFMEIALNAQKQYEVEHQEKLGLVQHNQNLQAAVAGQKEKIGQVQERLDHLTQERDRLLVEINALKTVADENIGLKAQIKLLEDQKRLMDEQIATLRTEINELRKPSGDMSHIGKLTGAGVRMELEKNGSGGVDSVGVGGGGDAVHPVVAGSETAEDQNSTEGI